MQDIGLLVTFVIVTIANNGAMSSLVHVSYCGVYKNFLDYVPGNEIAGYRICIYSTLLDKSKLFSPVLIPIWTATSV